LKVAYHHLSEAEHAWHTNEHTNEQQDLELEERAVVIASLEQQVQVLQLQVPPAPVAPVVEPDAVLDVNKM
jgi:hypothetical protein